MLVVIDEFTREFLAIEVGRRFTSDDVIGVLQYLFAIRGVLEHIRSDNGPEFVAKGIRTLVGPGRRQHSVHCQEQSLGEWLGGVIQRKVSCRAAQRRAIPRTGGRSLGD